MVSACFGRFSWMPWSWRNLPNCVEWRDCVHSFHFADCFGVRVVSTSLRPGSMAPKLWLESIQGASKDWMTLCPWMTQICWCSGMAAVRRHGKCVRRLYGFALIMDGYRCVWGQYVSLVAEMAVTGEFPVESIGHSQTPFNDLLADGNPLCVLSHPKRKHLLIVRKLLYEGNIW